MKKAITIFSFLLFFSFTNAQSYLNVKSKNSTISQFELSETEITFSESGDMMITKRDGQPVTYLFSAVEEITFSSILLNVENALSKSNVSFYVQNNFLYIMSSDNAKMENITIYNVVGRSMIFTKNLDNSRISIASLPAGIYVVKVGITSYKFVKK